MLRSASETIVPYQLSKELLVIRCSALGSFAPTPKVLLEPIEVFPSPCLHSRNI